MYSYLGDTSLALANGRLACCRGVDGGDGLGRDDRGFGDSLAVHDVICVGVGWSRIRVSVRVFVDQSSIEIGLEAFLDGSGGQQLFKRQGEIKIDLGEVAAEGEPL